MVLIRTLQVFMFLANKYLLICIYHKQFVKQLMVVLILLLCSTSLLSCSIPLKREDISSDEKYSQMIGKIYKTKQKLNVVGIKYDTSTNHIDFYSIIGPSGGIAGPEVVKCRSLPKGSILKIIKIIKISPSVFIGQDTRFEVVILDSSAFEGVEMEIYSAFETYTRNPNDQTMFILNSKYFEYVP